MRRRIYIIQTVIFSLLWAASVFAAVTDEVSAPWERERDGALWSERLLDAGNVMNNNEGVMPLNAFCDESAFVKVARDRKNLGGAIETAITRGVVDEGVKLCAILLKRAAALDVVSLNTHERDMVNAVSISGTQLYTAGAGLVKQGSSEQYKDYLMAGSAPGNSGSPSGKVSKQARSDKPADTLSDNVNLTDYSTDCACVDYFRLVLYQWEGIPLDRSAHIPSFPSESRSRRSSFISSLSITISFNHKETRTKKRLPCPGAVPAVPRFRHSADSSPASRNGIVAGTEFNALCAKSVTARAPRPVTRSRQPFIIEYCNALISKQLPGGSA